MAELDSTELHIRDTPQYFFDTGMIEEIQNITRTVHSPVMFDGNPVIKKDRPWEHHVNMHADDYKVWRDDGGVFHILYSDFDIDHDNMLAVLAAGQRVGDAGGRATGGVDHHIDAVTSDHRHGVVGNKRLADVGADTCVFGARRIQVG